mmetsp:Transcript_119049/g.336707  ORF Transcript_119049/g.336707 Transcript_119049/m.336707 type:complete len:263 (+) Transcript_119049:588-1376(+)
MRTRREEARDARVHEHASSDVMYDVDAAEPMRHAEVQEEPGKNLPDENQCERFRHDLPRQFVLDERVIKYEEVVHREHQLVDVAHDPAIGCCIAKAGGNPVPYDAGRNNPEQKLQEGGQIPLHDPIIKRHSKHDLQSQIQYAPNGWREVVPSRHLPSDEPVCIVDVFRQNVLANPLRTGASWQQNGCCSRLLERDGPLKRLLPQCRVGLISAKGGTMSRLPGFVLLSLHEDAVIQLQEDYRRRRKADGRCFHPGRGIGISEG